MALFMLMGKYTPESIKGILETGSNREEAARGAVEAAGGKLLGFYGMFGQDHNVAIIVDVPGNPEYIGAIGPALMAGVFSQFKSIPLYTAADMQKGSQIAKKVGAGYRPPGR